jgi:3-methyladenine DNA glycosylase/8-oxoguanine DNA glycosylase
MRALAWPDAFPEGDAGIMKALGERRRRPVRELAREWQPWRAYAVMHLWHASAARAPALEPAGGASKRPGRNTTRREEAV